MILNRPNVTFIERNEASVQKLRGKIRHIFSRSCKCVSPPLGLNPIKSHFLICKRPSIKLPFRWLTKVVNFRLDAGENHFIGKWEKTRFSARHRRDTKNVLSTVNKSLRETSEKKMSKPEACIGRENIFGLAYRASRLIGFWKLIYRPNF